MGDTRGERLRQALGYLESGAFADAARAAEPVYLADTADPEAMLLLGLAVAGCGHPDLGADLLDEVARRAPTAAHPATDLMRLLSRAELFDEVGHYLDAAFALAPADARLLAAAASWWLERGDNARAASLLREAEQANPALPVAQLGLATVEAEQGELDVAERRLRALIARGGGSPAAFGNLATVLGVANRFDEAFGWFDRATEAAPGNVQLAVNHGMALLKAGRLAEGWGAFNRRLELPGQALLPPGRLLPVREGGDGRWLEGRTVLVTHDSGFGDTLQFARYLPLLADAGARVVVWVPDPLRRLMQMVRGVAHVMSGMEAWPAFDWHCPIIRLAEVFGTTLDTVPANGPYLRADPRSVAAWRERLPGGERRVGVVWAGSARANTPRLAAVDRRRSMDPALLAPLIGVPGLQFVSLQLGQSAPSGVFAAMEGVADFADTAAIIGNLHAVVSVDTSVAHLAGAMGVPVLLLDRFDNCWRWLAGRTDSPWYPSVRIHRQTTWGDWHGPVQAAADALGEL